MEIQDKKQGKNKQTKQLALWIGALILGAILGALGIEVLNGMMNFVATVYTRLFQLLAVPTIALAVITTLSSLGNQADTGKIFRHAIVYTLLTTIAAAAVGLVLYNIVAPGNLPTDMVLSGTSELPQNLEQTSYYDHILGVIPNNIIKPLPRVTCSPSCSWQPQLVSPWPRCHRATRRGSREGAVGITRLAFHAD